MYILSTYIYILYSSLIMRIFKLCYQQKISFFFFKISYPLRVYLHFDVGFISSLLFLSRNTSSFLLFTHDTPRECEKMPIQLYQLLQFTACSSFADSFLRCSLLNWTRSLRIVWLTKATGVFSFFSFYLLLCVSSQLVSSNSFFPCSSRIRIKAFADDSVGSSSSSALSYLSSVTALLCHLLWALQLWSCLVSRSCFPRVTLFFTTISTSSALRVTYS